MKEIREIFETVRTYCGMMFLDAKMPRCEDAKSVTKAARQLGSGATHVAHCDKFRRAAFTLAEVLITLGIIGVVAALTLPTLIQNHQKQVYVTQLKKAYSTLGNAFNKMAVDEGVVDWNQTYCGSFYGSYDGDEESYLKKQEQCFKQLLKQFKVVRSKTSKDNLIWNDIVYCSSYGCTRQENDEFITTDGITYIFPCAGIFYSSDGVLVDVNGIEKGPNKEGRDVFAFGISLDDNKILPDGTYNDYWKDCSATNLSTSCTAKVLIEGKMNY